MAGRTKKPIDVGTRFGNWVVRDNTVTNKHHMSQCVCECDCGKWAVVIAANLRENKTSKCTACMGRALVSARAKITADQVHDLRRRIRSGVETLKELSAAFNLSIGTLHMIDRGKQWSHLEWQDGLEPRLHRTTTRLEREEVIEIKRRLSLGERQVTIAKDFPQTSVKTISAIKRGECFRSVPWPDGSIR